MSERSWWLCKCDKHRVKRNKPGRENWYYQLKIQTTIPLRKRRNTRGSSRVELIIPKRNLIENTFSHFSSPISSRVASDYSSSAEGRFLLGVELLFLELNYNVGRVNLLSSRELQSEVGRVLGRVLVVSLFSIFIKEAKRTSCHPKQ